MSMMVSHNFIAGMPSIRDPASSLQTMKSAQTYVIQIYTERHLMLILSLSDLLENRRLGIITVCSLLFDFLLVDGCVLIEDRMVGSTL